MATKVYLGGILFSPGPRKKLKFNNPRVISKIDIPGSSPVNQDMGPDETTLAWDGVLDGEDAYQKAIQIEIMKDAGQIVQLVVSDCPELCKDVRIRTFPWDLIRKDRVEYSIDLVAEMPPPVESYITVTAAQGTPPGDGEQAAPSPPPGNTYIIKQGDTLWSLAQNNFGDGTRWREIASTNGIMDPAGLQVGQEITLPT